MKAKDILNFYENEQLTSDEIYYLISQYFVKKIKSAGADIETVSYPDAQRFPLAVFTFRNSEQLKLSELMKKFKTHVNSIMKFVGKNRCDLLVGGVFMDIRFFFPSMTFKNSFILLRYEVSQRRNDFGYPEFYTCEIEFGMPFVSEYVNKTLIYHAEFVNENLRKTVVYALIDSIVKALRLISLE